MNVLILGGHGFVGKSVVDILRNTKHKVFSLSRRDGLNLEDYACTLKYFRKIKPDVIINCAAHVGSLHYVTDYAADVVDDNMQIILNIYRAVKEFCHNAVVINPIANCSYPANISMQIESEFWNGPVHKTVWAYGNTKRMQVVISECYAMEYNIRTINFIVPNCYGPGDSIDPNRTHALNGMIIRMLKAKKNKAREFEIWGTGKPIREWIYVKDLANALANGMNINQDKTCLINIAQHKAYSIKDIAKMIKEIIGYKGKIAFNFNYSDGADMRKLDNTLFRKNYPNFQFTEIHKGIKETIKYYQKVLAIKK